MRKLFAFLLLSSALSFAQGVTPNLGLTKPTVGDSAGVWGQLLNADLDLIDAAWGHAEDVKAKHGAKGNGIADDTGAIQAAYSAAAATLGGVVFFPPGTYMISATGLTLPDNGTCANMQGSGKDVTKLKASGAAAAVIFKGRASAPVGCFMRDFTVDGNKLAVLGLQLQKGKGWRADSIKVVDTTSDAIQLGSSAGTNVEFWEETFTSIYTAFQSANWAPGTTPNYGLHLMGTAHDADLISGTFVNAKLAGIRTELGSGGNNFIATHVYGFPIATYSPTYAFEDAGDANTWIGFYADSPAVSGFHFLGNRTRAIAGRILWGDTTTFPAANLATVDAGATNISLTASDCDKMNSGATAVVWPGGIPGAGSEVHDITGCTDVFMYEYFQTAGRSLVLGTNVNGGGKLVVAPTSPATIVITARGAASQTADLIDWRNSINGVLGSIDASGLYQSSANTLRVAADFTTAANTNLQTITGLSTSICLNGTCPAKKISFHCSLTYSQATANAAVAFGFQAATTAPTAINANGQENTSLTAFTAGSLRALASTTATNIVSATPSAFGALGTAADMFNATLDGTIENPTNTANVINFMVSTANSGNAVSVYRGSYCEFY